MACAIDLKVAIAQRAASGIYSCVSVTLALVVSAFVYESRPDSRKLRIHEQASVSPYKNTRPAVKYIGDAACVGCHREIAQTYRDHPMGRSLFPIAQAPTIAGQKAGSGPLVCGPRIRILPSKIGTDTSSTKRRDGMVKGGSLPRPKVKSGSWSGQGEWGSPT